MRMLYTLFFILLTQIFSSTLAQFQWKVLDEPAGGTTNSIYAKGDSLFTIENKVIYYSTNRGGNWTKVTSSRRVGGLVYTDDGGFIAESYDNGYYAILKSYDLKNWNIVLPGGCWDLIRDRYGNLYASMGDSNLYKSSDNGNSWEKYFEVPTTYYSRLLANNEYIFFMLNDRMYRRKINSPDPVKVVALPDYYTDYFMSANNSGTIYRVRIYGDPKVNFSTNNGDTWGTMNPNSLYPGLQPGGVLCTESSVLISNADTSDIPLIKGNLDGTGWVPFSNGIPPMTGVQLITSGDYLYANAKGYGILRKDDLSKSWRPVFNGIAEVDFNKIIITHDSTWYAATSGKGVIKSTDSGLRWSACNNGLMDYNSASIVQTADGDLFTSSYYYLYRSTDDGNSWIKISKPGFRYDWKVALYTDNSNNLYYHSYYENIYKSSDKGLTWQVYLRMKTPGGMNIKDGVIYATINDIKPKVFRTTNDGISWALLYSDNDFNIRYGDPVIDVSGNIFIPGNNKIIKSSDGGLTWKIYKPGILNHSVRSIFSDNKGRIFYSTNNEYSDPAPEFYYSDDQGEHWINATGELPGVEVRGMIILDGKYLIATSGGLWINTNDVTAVKENDIKPEVFTLQQNYPNPFNPSTKIEYSIPEGGFVQLKIYDVLGKEIAALVNEYKRAGTYSINYNPAELNSGVYFYKLQWGVYSNVKKMIYLK